jgi:hypothetical protein
MERSQINMICKAKQPSDEVSSSLNYLLPNGLNPLDVIYTLQKQILSIISENYEACVQQNQTQTMLTYLRLFPLIGESQRGLDYYLSYLKNMIIRQCQDGMRQITSLEPSKQHKGYVELLTKLYENVALIIDQQASLVKNLFVEPRFVSFFIQTLKGEADKQSCLFVDSFCDHQRLEKRVGFYFLLSVYI